MSDVLRVGRRLDSSNWQPESNVDGKTGLSTEHQLIGGKTSDVVLGAVVGVSEGFDKITPSALLLVSQRSQHTQEGAVVSLHWISLWVVRTRSDFLSPSDGTELFDGVRFEIPALVTVEPLWESIVDKELLPQTFGYCACFLVSRWYGHCILGVVIGDDKDVFGVLTIRLNGQEIHADQLHGSCCLDVDKGCSFLRLRLSSNTSATGLDLPFDVSSHLWPVEPGSDQVKSTFNPKMPHVIMQTLEHNWS